MTLGIDIDDENFTIKNWPLFVSQGHLRCQIQAGEVVTDSQLDLILEEWELNHSESLQDSIDQSKDSSNAQRWSSLLRSVDLSQSTSFLPNQFKRSWNDEPEYDNDDQLSASMNDEEEDIVSPSNQRLRSHEQSLRMVFHDVMNDSDQKQRLTNDELEDKVRKLSAD